MMDEAQNLSRVHKDHHDAAGRTLQIIHEGGCDGPVVFLTAGLGHTQDVLEGLGILRLPKKSVVNLGRLTDQDARRMLEEYLTEGLTKSMPEGSEKLRKDVLARSHGWPQHIVGYADEVLDVLSAKGDHRILTERDCQVILREGDAVREEYYDGRCSGEKGKGIEHREMALLGALVQGPEKTTRWDDTTLAHLGTSDLRLILGHRLHFGRFFEQIRPEASKKAWNPGISGRNSPD